MKVFKMTVSILVEGDSAENAVKNALSDLEYVLEMDTSICGYDKPRAPKLYKEYDTSDWTLEFVEEPK